MHLALPKPSAFTRQKEPASASVVLHLRGGSALEAGQVSAIEHLVASSIPRMPVENVTVVDQFGRLLSQNNPDSEAALTAERFEQQRRAEAVYVQRIQELLEPMTGRGRVSAQVSIDMSFAETEQASETYGPDAGMIRSEQISESGDVAALGAQGVPGAASNNPDTAAAAQATAEAAAAPAAPGGTAARTAVRNYEIDRTLTHTREAPGRITRVTAAVLVDNLPQVDAEGKTTWRELTDAELERIQTLVQQAVGFDAQRGDMVSVVNAPFARGTALEEPEPMPFWQHPRAQELLRIAVGGLAVLALIFLVLRPAFRQMLAPRVETAVATVLDDDEEPPVTLSGQPEPRAVPKPRPDPHVSAQAAMNFDEKLQVAKTAVSNDPKRVANVVRNWVDSDG